ncbi:MAG: TrkH family potassium uptake protein [Eubacteriales bacterium]|jgi:trk system potassium uptake protein TrkH
MKLSIWIITRLMGRVLLVQGLFLMVPALLSVAWGETIAGAFLLPAVCTMILGLLSFCIPEEKRGINIRESLVLVVLCWVIVSLIGAFPFVLSGAIPDCVDALFETVSGFTTTGATILPDIEALPKSVLFWRSFTHWIGGLGVLVFLFFIVPLLDGGAFRIFKAESPSTMKKASRTKDTVRMLLITYVILTFSMTVLLRLGGMSWYDAAVHTFSTVATAGFSTYNASIGHFDSHYINVVTTVYMTLSGVNFFIIFAVLQGRVREAVKDEELRLYLCIIGVSSLLIAWNLWGQQLFATPLICLEHAAFQVSSIITTTGFATVDYNYWPSLSKFILFMLTFVGACSSSTTCAIKVVRILILGKCIRRTMFRTVHPKSVRPIRLNGKVVSEEYVQGVQSFFLLFMLLFVVGTILTICMEGGDLDMITAMSATATTLSNVGPGLELVGPYNNFGFLSSGTKLLEILLMLIGRLELYTMMPLFFPNFWKS